MTDLLDFNFDFANDFVEDALEGMSPEEQQEVLAEMEVEEAEFKLEDGKLDLQRMTEEMGLFQKVMILLQPIFDFFESDEDAESIPKKELKAMALKEWEDEVSVPKKGKNFFLEAKKGGLENLEQVPHPSRIFTPSDAGLRASATELSAFIEKIEKQEWAPGEKMQVDVFVPGQEIQAPKEGHIQIITAISKGDAMSPEDEAWLAGLYNADVPNLWLGCEDVLDKIDANRPKEALKPEVDDTASLEASGEDGADGQTLDEMKGKSFDLKGGDVFEVSTEQGMVKIEKEFVTLNRVKYKVEYPTLVRDLDVNFHKLSFDKDGNVKMKLSTAVKNAVVPDKKVHGEVIIGKIMSAAFPDGGASKKSFKLSVGDESLKFSQA